MTKLTTAGYIVHDNEYTIHGYGPSADAAWGDAEHTLAAAQVVLLDDEEDSSEQHGAWTRRSGLHVIPATAALLREVEAQGGDTLWFRVGGVAYARGEGEEG